MPREPAGPMSDDFVITAERLFERYDLDGSGDINSTEELEQLITNLLYTLKANKEQSTFVQGRVAQMYSHGVWGAHWEKPFFVDWFHRSMNLETVPPPQS